ncbi:chaperone modulator CbpM [Aurantivibrio plasticivorans]
MTDHIHLDITIHELCDTADLTREMLIDLIEHGVIQPHGTTPDNWLFSAHHVSLTRRAVRLHRDLDIEWQTIGFVLQLLEERDQLREEIAMLKQRLSRFEVE